MAAATRGLIAAAFLALPTTFGAGGSGDRLLAESASARAARDYAALASRLDALRLRWHIPGMAAAVSEGDRIAWSQAFGHADLSTRVPATPATVFHLASLTKPFAAVVLLQLVESGQLDLDAPVERFDIGLKAAGTIRVRHLLTHTSEGTPGEVFRYNGNRFAELDKVLVAASGKPFAALVRERILDPLKLENTSPNPLNPAACALAGRDPAAFLDRSARGYAFDGRTPVEYPPFFVTAAGLVSTVGDVLRFSIALDEHRLLEPGTTRSMFTPARASNGKSLPYGFGWFVQQRRGVTVLWHYGWDRANSSLLVKVPERKVAFVLLANSEALSRKFDLGRDEDVTRSPFARAFLDTIEPH